MNHITSSSQLHTCEECINKVNFYCWTCQRNRNNRESVNWPQSLQSAERTLQKTTQQLHSWIPQNVVTQVQLSEMGGVGFQSRGQRSTADLWHTALLQPGWQIFDVGWQITQCWIMSSALMKMRSESPNSWSYIIRLKLSKTTVKKDLSFITMSVSCSNLIFLF